jgi:hypothetical protein
MDQTGNKNDMVDATDCLEAVGVFKSMKNIFFILAFISLLFLQVAFWLNDTGCINKTSSPYGQKAVFTGLPCPPGPFSRVAPQGPASPVPADTADKDDTAGKADTAEDKIDELVKEADELSKQTAEAKAPPAETKATRTIVIPPDDMNFFTEMFVPEVAQVTALVRTCNFILIIAACMYCLTLFMSIKISLAGRLGGINHISRAFFRSLFAFVLLIPWQLCTDGAATGAVYTPQELFSPAGLTAEATLLGQIFYYLRFTGLWAVVFVLLIGAQFSSKKWAKATLRRLGIAH